MQTSRSVNTLPPEILNLIVEHLSYKNATRSRGVSKQIKERVNANMTRRNKERKNNIEKIQERLVSLFPLATTKNLNLIRQRITKSRNHQYFHNKRRNSIDSVVNAFQALTQPPWNLSLSGIVHETELDFYNKDLTIANIQNFSIACANGALAKLKELYFQQNKIGDAGVTALAGAIASGALPNLQVLSLSSNQIGDTGMIAFADAIKPTPENPMGSLGALQYLSLTRNKIGDVGMTAFARAIKTTTSENLSGALAKLQWLTLSRNKIGDEGMNTFSLALAKGSLPALKTVVFNFNPGSDAPVKAACEKRGIKVAGY